MPENFKVFQLSQTRNSVPLAWHLTFSVRKIQAQRQLPPLLFHGTWGMHVASLFQSAIYFPGFPSYYSASSKA